MKKIEYLLTVLTEEAAEIIQEATKSIRFGLDSKHPVTGITNVENLKNEFNDLFALMTMLEEEGVFPDGFLNYDKVDLKRDRVYKYMKVD